MLVGLSAEESNLKLLRVADFDSNRKVADSESKRSTLEFSARQKAQLLDDPLE